jgi:hypothetical protein
MDSDNSCQIESSVKSIRVENITTIKYNFDQIEEFEFLFSHIRGFGFEPILYKFKHTSVSFSLSLVSLSPEFLELQKLLVKFSF